MGGVEPGVVGVAGGVEGVGVVAGLWVGSAGLNRGGDSCGWIEGLVWPVVRWGVSPAVLVVVVFGW